MRPGAAVSVSAVRSSQPAWHAAEACSMQLVQPHTPSSAEEDEEIHHALPLKYVPRYVAQRCNSRVATFEAEMQRMGVATGGALFNLDWCT